MSNVLCLSIVLPFVHKSSHQCDHTHIYSTYYMRSTHTSIYTFRFGHTNQKCGLNIDLATLRIYGSSARKEFGALAPWLPSAAFPPGVECQQTIYLYMVGRPFIIGPQSPHVEQPDSFERTRRIVYVRATMKRFEVYLCSLGTIAGTTIIRAQLAHRKIIYSIFLPANTTNTHTQPH